MPLSPEQLKSLYDQLGIELPEESVTSKPSVLSRLGSGVLGALDVIPQIRQAIYDRPVTYWTGQATGDEEMQRRAMEENVQPVYSQVMEAALPPERTGFAGAVARPILSTLGNVATDPVTWGFMGAGALAGAGKAAGALATTEEAARAGLGVGQYLAPEVLSGASRLVPSFLKGADALENARKAALIGRIAGGAEKAAAGGFAAEMIPSGLSQLGESYRSVRDEGLTPQAVEQGIGGGISTAFGAAGARSVIKPWLAPRLEALRRTKPPAAAAMESQLRAEAEGRPTPTTEEVSGVSPLAPPAPKIEAPPQPAPQPPTKNPPVEPQVAPEQAIPREAVPAPVPEAAPAVEAPVALDANSRRAVFEAVLESTGDQDAALAAVAKLGNKTAPRTASQPVVETAPVKVEEPPHGVAKSVVTSEPSKPLYELSADELEAKRKEVKSADSTLLSRLFGDRASEYEKAQRVSNNPYAPQEKQDAAFALVQELEAQLSEAQRNELFGIGSKEPTIEDIQDYQRAIGALDWESPGALGRSLRWALTRVGKGKDPTQMSHSEQVAYAQLRTAAEGAAQRGWDTREVSQAALRAAGERFAPEDVEFMLGRFRPRAEPPPVTPEVTPPVETAPVAPEPQAAVPEAPVPAPEPPQVVPEPSKPSSAQTAMKKRADTALSLIRAEPYEFGSPEWKKALAAVKAAKGSLVKNGADLAKGEKTPEQIELEKAIVALDRLIPTKAPEPAPDIQSQLEASIEAKGGVPVTKEVVPTPEVAQAEQPPPIEQPPTVAPEAPTSPVEPTTPPVPSLEGKTITLAPEKASRLATRAAEARARLAAKAAKLGKGPANIGVDPQDIVDYSYIVADWMHQGIKTRTEIVQKLVREFGDAIRQSYTDAKGVVHNLLDEIVDAGRQLFLGGSERTPEGSIGRLPSETLLPEEVPDTQIEGGLPRAGIPTKIGERVAPPEMAPTASGKNLQRPDTLAMFGSKTKIRAELEKKLAAGEITQELFNSAALDNFGIPPERVREVSNLLYTQLTPQEIAARPKLTPEALFDEVVGGNYDPAKGTGRRGLWDKLLRETRGNEDVAQDSLIKAIKTWDPKKGSFEGHAIGLSRNLLKTFYKRAKREESLTTEAESANIGKKEERAGSGSAEPTGEAIQLAAPEATKVETPTFLNALYQQLSGRPELDSTLNKLRDIASKDSTNPGAPLLKSFPELWTKFGEDAPEMALIFGHHLKGMKPTEIATELFRKAEGKDQFGNVKTGEAYSKQDIVRKVNQVKKLLGVDVGEGLQDAVVGFLGDKYPTKPPLEGVSLREWSTTNKKNVLSASEKVTPEQAIRMVENILYAAKETISANKGKAGRLGREITGLLDLPPDVAKEVVAKGWAVPTTIEGETYYRVWHPELSKLAKPGKRPVNLNMFGLQDLYEVAEPLVLKGYERAREAAQYGLDLISTGVTDALRFSSAMIRQFGDSIKPFIRELYNKAKGVWDNVSFGPLPKEPKGETLGSLGGALQPFLEKLIGSRGPVKSIFPEMPKGFKKSESEKIATAIPGEFLKRGVEKGLAPEDLSEVKIHPKAPEKTGFMNSAYNSYVDQIKDKDLRNTVANNLKVLDPLFSRNRPVPEKETIKKAAIALAADPTANIERVLQGHPLNAEDGLALRSLAQTLQKDQISSLDKLRESIQLPTSDATRDETVRQATKNYVEAVRRAQITLFAAAEDGTAVARALSARKIAAWATDPAELFKRRFIDSARSARIPKKLARQLADVWYDINNWDPEIAKKYMDEHQLSLTQVVDNFNKTMRNSLDPNWWQMGLEAWKSSLFTIPGTVANVGSNTSMAAIRRVEERVENAIDAARVKLAETFPVFDYLGKERLHRSMPVSVALEVLKRATGEAGPGVIADMADAIMLRPIGSSRRVSGSLQDIDPIHSSPAIPGKFGEAVRTLLKTNEAGDNFAKTFALNHYLGNASWLEAYKQAEARGLPKSAIEPLFWRLFNEAQAFRAAFDGGQSKVWENHTDHVWDRQKLYKVHAKAEMDMKQDVFQEELKGIARTADLAIRGTPAELIAPFRKTPYNIAKETLKRTPAGLIMALRKIKKFKDGLPIGDESSFKEVISKMAETGELSEVEKLMSQSAVGTIGSMIMLAVLGENIQGGGPLSPKEEEAKKLTGWRPYSIKADIPGVGPTYATYNRLEPLSSLIGIATDLRDATARGDMDRADKATQVLLATISENMTNKTFLSGLEGLFTAWSDPARYAGRLFKQTEASLIPNTFYYVPIGTLAKALDPVYRDTEAFAELSGEWDKSPLLAKIPGASESVKPQYGPSGEQRKRGGNFFTRLLLPTEISQAKSDPAAIVANEAERVGYVMGAPRKYEYLGGSKVYYTPAEMKLLTKAKQTAIKQVQQVIKDPSYKRLPDNELDPNYELGDKTKQDVLKSLFAKHYRMAKEGIKSDLYNRARKISSAMRAT